MVAYSGLGWLPIALQAALIIIWRWVWAGSGSVWIACVVAVPSALVLGLVNLSVALSVNRADLPGTADAVWTARHRSSGTPVQCYTPSFLVLAGLFGAGWTVQWVPWPVAVAAFGVMVAAYYLVPALLRRRAMAATVARRAAFAQTRGWAFGDRVPGLSGRWQTGPLQRLSTSGAQLLNSPPRTRLRRPFAVMSGTHQRVTLTIADAFEPVPFAPFRAWQQRQATVCAVHLDIVFPSIRVALLSTGTRAKRRAVEIDTLRPDFAEALVTQETVKAMLDADVNEWSIQGRDVLVVLRDQPADSDLQAVRAVERLTTVIARLPTGLGPWADDAVPDLPLGR